MITNYVLYYILNLPLMLSREDALICQMPVLKCKIKIMNGVILLHLNVSILKADIFCSFLTSLTLQSLSSTCISD